MQPTKMDGVFRQLRSEGFKVKVLHHRRYYRPMAQEVKERYGYGRYQRVYEHRNFTQLKPAPEGWFLDQSGGYCMVYVTDPEGKMWTGSAQTFDYDPETIRYHRRMLTAIALGRAVRNMEKAGVIRRRR